MIQLSPLSDPLMSKKDWIEPIPLEALEHIIEHWSDITNSHEECGSAYYFSKSGLLMRFNQICKHPRLLSKLRGGRDIYVIDAETLMLEDVEEWKRELEKYSQLQCSIFIVGLDFLLSEMRHDIFSYIDLFRSQHTHISFIFFFSIDFTSEKYSSLFHNKSTFTQNVIIHPLHSREINAHFIKHMSWLWNLKISKIDINKILSICGKNFYFVKQLLRIYRRMNKIPDLKELLCDPSMKQKLKMVWDHLNDSEKSVLIKLSDKSPITLPSEKHSLLFLKNTGWVEGNVCAMPILESYFSQLYQSNSIAIDNNLNISINHVPMDREFSVSEKQLLKIFLTQKGITVDRDQIAHEIWGETSDDQYSEWAIDQHISRLRKKLKRLGVQMTIQTQKGKGYIYDC